MDDIPQTLAVVDDLRNGRLNLGFSGDVLAQLRGRWLRGSRGVAMGDWDAESIHQSCLRRGASMGILEEVEIAGVFPPRHHSTRVTRDGPYVLLLTKNWRLSTIGCRPKRIWFFDTLRSATLGRGGRRRALLLGSRRFGVARHERGLRILQCTRPSV